MKTRKQYFDAVKNAKQNYKTRLKKNIVIDARQSKTNYENSK